MEIFSDIQHLHKYLKQIRLQEKSIGFVPTMGALHQGHLELINSSTRQNDITICSIFVNPTQFNNPSDLANYPRENESDIYKLNSVDCNVVFIPPVDIMYEKNFIINFDFGYLEEIMEGKYRPGHFKGVGLIVAKLFNLVKPDRAYFGKKDLQQLSLIKIIAKELMFNIEIIPVDTIREKDGLAMSSRNTLLSDEDRVQASQIYKALITAKNKLNQGENVNSVKEFVGNYFSKLDSFKLEYFEIVNTNDLKNIDKIKGDIEVSLCIAAYLGKVRLIDNISLI